MAYVSEMTRQSKPRSGMQLGGMGTGGVELRQDGIFYHWNFINACPFGTGKKLDCDPQSVLFFKIRWQEEGKEPQLKILQIEDNIDVGSMTIGNSYYLYPWMSGVDKIEYEASFPFAKLTYRDAEMPFDVRMTAWTPFIPHDEKNSSLPTIIFDFEVIPKARRKMEILLMASMRNLSNFDEPDKLHTSKIIETTDYKAFEMSSSETNTKRSAFGTMSMVSCSSKSTYYTGWEHIHPYYETVRDCKTLPNVDDTAGRNSPDPITGKNRGDKRFWSTIGVDSGLAGQIFQHRFIASFDFPNLYASTTKDGNQFYKGVALETLGFEGHYHNNFFNSSIDVGSYVHDNIVKLHSETKRFHQSFFNSSLPTYALDQINSHLNTLASSTWFVKDGGFGVEEGRDPDYIGGISTIDVLNYAMVIVEALFPRLAQAILKQSREMQFASGNISHHAPKKYHNVSDLGHDSERRDLPIQYSVMVLRNYFWTNDLAFLKEMWPSVKRALGYAYGVNDEDGDGIPDMKGIMSSYDNFPMYGTSAYIGSQWLSAMRFAIEAAAVLGDQEAELNYTKILEKATQSFEERLWTGRYYRLSNDLGGPKNEKDDGCLTDQLIGQWAGLWTNMGDICDKERIVSALKTIKSMSYKQNQGLSNCRWPQDKFVTQMPADIWVDQANTCWTGVELGFAGFMLYSGLYADAMEIVRNVDERHKKWGTYWDHFECGGHYCRPLSAWSIVLAAAGFSAHLLDYKFAPKAPGEMIQLFITGADFTGTYRHDIYDGKVSFTIASGIMTAKSIELEIPAIAWGKVKLLVDGQDVSEQVEVSVTEKSVKLTFATPIQIKKDFVCVN